MLTAYEHAGGAVGSLADRVVRWQSFAPAAAALFGLDQARPDLFDAAIGRLHEQAARLEIGRSPV